MLDPPENDTHTTWRPNQETCILERGGDTSRPKLDGHLFARVQVSGEQDKAEAPLPEPVQHLILRVAFQRVFPRRQRHYGAAMIGSD